MLKPQDRFSAFLLLIFEILNSIILVMNRQFKEISIKDGQVMYSLHEPVRNLYERLVSVKNNFEPKKAFTGKAKAFSGAKIAAMLPR